MPQTNWAGYAPHLPLVIVLKQKNCFGVKVGVTNNVGLFKPRTILQFKMSPYRLTVIFTKYKILKL